MANVVPQSSTLPAETRTVLENIRWETYVDLTEQREGSVPRMTYDNGVLELTNPRRQHENIGRLLGRILETYTEVHEIEIQSVASTTFKRKELKHGFEADESYYVSNAELVRPKEEVDLRVDPPPDLVIEVEITSSAIDKLKLFHAMGIPEVWRHDGSELFMYRHQNKKYESIIESVEVPGLTIAMIAAVLNERFNIGETKLIRQFRTSIS